MNNDNYSEDVNNGKNYNNDTNDNDNNDGRVSYDMIVFFWYDDNNHNDGDNNDESKITKLKNITIMFIRKVIVIKYEIIEIFNKFFNKLFFE